MSKHFFLHILLQAFSDYVRTGCIFVYQLTDLVSDLWMYGVPHCSSLANRMCFMACAEGKLQITPFYYVELFRTLPVKF